jgi:hypothetical protein
VVELGCKAWLKNMCYVPCVYIKNNRGRHTHNTLMLPTQKIKKTTQTLRTSPRPQYDWIILMSSLSRLLTNSTSWFVSETILCTFHQNLLTNLCSLDEYVEFIRVAQALKRSTAFLDELFWWRTSDREDCYTHPMATIPRDRECHLVVFELYQD